MGATPPSTMRALRQILLIHLEHDGRADHRVRPGFAIQHLVIRAARAGPRRRQLNRSQHFVLRQDVFARGVHARQLEEFSRGNHALARRSRDVKLRVQRHQRRRGVRRMHDVAGPAAENGVELILARSRKTNVAAVLEARKTVAEIPAPGALANVARQRSGIANLRRAHLLGGFRQHRVFFANARIAAQMCRA